MDKLPSIEALTEAFLKLPSVGSRSASRIAYAVLEMKKEDVEAFANALTSAVNNISKCPKCGFYKEGEACPICDSENRDHSKVLVVSSYKDALAIENSKKYDGLYHILFGYLSASKGVYPEDLNIEPLLDRLNEGEVKEVILGTNPTIEGETTSLYIAKLLEGYDVSVTRLGFGLSVGSSLEYSDPLTLEKAFEGRRKL